MPRRLGRFQKAFINWHDPLRFHVPISLKMIKPGSVSIRLFHHPDCMQIAATATNLSVWVDWQGATWDALLDLDVLQTQNHQRLTCRLCEKPRKIWPSLDVLWEDHLFEPFLKWVNERYAKAEILLLFGNMDSITTAKLSRHGQLKDQDKAIVVIPLQMNLSP